MTTPEREIRAHYTPEAIRIYQAYSDEIANSALTHQTFVSPPFSMNRMTWIKPSFLWMMYRAGWGYKDQGQKRILAIDITHEGFSWALAHSCPSTKPPELDAAAWVRLKEKSPVRVQWDPERDLHFKALQHRTIQVGLSGEAVLGYVQEWIRRITDVTGLAHEIASYVQVENLELARSKLPEESTYIAPSR